MLDLPDRWTEQQKNFFSRVFRHIESNQELFAHPLAETIPQDHWATVCWNLAYFSTHCLQTDAPFLVHETSEGIVLAEEVTPQEMQ